MNSTQTGENLLSNAFAVCFTGKRERAQYLLEETSRMGINGVNVIWSYPSPYRKFILSRIPHIKDLDQHPGAWGATIGQYRAVKTAYELGMEHALFMEDDCRFLKDRGKVLEALSNVPVDWDLLMLDHFVDESVADCNGYWKGCGRTFSTACYIANRKAMERLILMYESPVSGKYRHPVMRNCDHWSNTKYIGGDVRIYCAYPNLAIQCNCGDTTNYNATLGAVLQKGFYRNLHLNLGDYAGFHGVDEDAWASDEDDCIVASPVGISPMPAETPLVANTDEGTVDVLYVVGKGAAGQDNLPLRWSLRSLAKHAKNVGRIIVVGSPPEWLSDKVVKVPVQDKATGKQWNILNCIAEEIRATGLYKPFLYSSDDHFLCKDADLRTWPRLERGRLLSLNNYTKVKGHAPGTYQKSLCATHDCLASEHLSCRKACLHFNTWMDGRNLEEVLAIANRHRHLSSFGLEPTCLFNAVFEKNHPNSVYKTITNGDDRKVHVAGDIDAKIKSGALGFSTNPTAETNSQVIAKMNALYPNKSPWEK